MIELFSSYSAEIIALCALLFTAYQIIVQRRHNILSVQPHITTFSNKNRNKEAAQLQVELMNNGLGPAFINEFQVYLDGKPCEANVAIDSLLKNYQVKKQVSVLTDDYAMPSGEARSLISIIFPFKTEDDMEKMEKRLDRLDLLIKYSCAYGKTKTYDSRKKSQ